MKTDIELLMEATGWTREYCIDWLEHGRIQQEQHPGPVIVPDDDPDDFVPF